MIALETIEAIPELHKEYDVALRSSGNRVQGEQRWAPRAQRERDEAHVSSIFASKMYMVFLGL